MRTVIDARIYGPRHGGLGRYVQQLCLRLPSLRPSDTWIFLLGDQAEADYRADVGTVPANAQLVRAPWRWYTLAEQLHLPRLIRRLAPDVTHYPHFNVPMFAPQPFVVTIHDLIINHFPTSRATTLNPVSYGLKLLAYRAVINRALCRARQILVPTQFVADDICAVYPWVESRRITVTHEGVADGITNVDGLGNVVETRRASSLPHGIHPPYSLYVGNAFPHKDVITAIRAFADLRRRGVVQTFVHVWREDEFLRRLQRQVEAEGISDGVVWTGYLPDDQLASLYRNAAAYVFPSRYEGFGLPPLEAQAAGCPVVVARSSCLPEVLGDSVAWFEPGNVSQMVAAVERLAADSAYRSDLVQRGVENVGRFSWERLATQTGATYGAVDK